MHLRPTATGPRFGLAPRIPFGALRSGYSLVELMVSLGIMGVILAVVASAFITVKRSVEATNHYLLETNNANRLVDYVGRDLNRAVRVGQLVGATNTTFKTQSNFVVTETNFLTINVPDYYGSNTPNNVNGSTFKVGRNSRAALGSTGTVPWADAFIVNPINGTKVARYAPAASASDEIQVRYFRGPRSAQDSTVCYFRQEYPPASNTPLSGAMEIAEQVTWGTSTTALIVSGNPTGTVFQIQSNFTPRYSLTATTASTNQIFEVPVQSPRRD